MSQRLLWAVLFVATGVALTLAVVFVTASINRAAPVISVASKG